MRLAIIRRRPPLRSATFAKLLAAAALLGMAFAAAPRTAQAQADAEPAAAPRPRVALVLSGGGARGLAHVGVLKVLQELQVPVDVVAGTSMGAIVGGAYAAGHTVDALEKLVIETPWPRLLQDRPPRDELAYRRRQEDLQLPSRIDFGVDRSGLRGPAATLGSFELERVLRQISGRVSQLDDTDRLPLPFRAVATDLVTGEARVMHGPSLFEVMRASMSVPGAFAPIEVDGRLLADGGLVRNLPVDVARAMGADVIIAVNVGTPLLPREQVVGALGVTQQMFNILTEQNVQASLAQLKPADILITPDLNGISFLDFSNPRQAIQRGEAAARAVADRLRTLAAAPQRYAQWNQARIRPRFDDAAFELADLKIEGELRADKRTLAREFGLRPGDTVRSADIEAGVNRLLGLGDYDRVEVRTVGSGAARELVVLPIESPLATNRLRLGLRLESNFKDTNTFSVLLQHTYPWVNSAGGEWRNFLQIGQLRRVETEFYQPFTDGSPLFVAPSVRYQASTRDLYQGERRVARLGYSIASADVSLGLRLGRIGELRLGVGRVRNTAEVLIPEQGSTLGEAGYQTVARFSLDTLNSALFPTRGSYVDAELSRVRFSQTSEQTQASLSTLHAWELQQWAAALSADYARADRGFTGRPLGGFLRLSGAPTDSLDGAQVLLLRGTVTRAIGAMPTGLGGAVRLGASFEAGNAVAAGQGLRLGELEHALTLYVAIDTRLGPVFLGAGRTQGRGNGVYLFLGRP